ncbi:MAG: tetratricopeptide repeat protein [Bacteroidales bacterium]
MEKPNTKPSQRLFQRLHTPQILAILAGLIILIYGQSIGFQFSWFDDDAILLRNQAYVSDPGNLLPAMMRDAEFREKSMELYRPLQNVSFIIDATLSGFRPGMFHFTNLLLHFLVCAIAFLLFTELGFGRAVAMLGSVILAIHPVFAFTVSWIPARGDLLLALWTLFSLLFFIRYLKYRKSYQLILHLAGFAMALLSKESGIIIPFIALFYYLFIYSSKHWGRWQIITILAYVIIMIPYFYLRSGAIADIRPGAFGAGPLLQNLPVIPETLLKFFIPYPIVALPFYDSLRTAGGLIFLGLLIYLALKQKRDSALWIAGAGWFLAFTLPSMLYRPDWSAYIYDYIIHRSYLPLIGILLLLLLIIRNVGEKLMVLPWSRLTISIILLFIALSFSFSRTFRNPMSFWEYAVSTNPESPFAHTYLGGAYFFSEQPLKAIQSYDKAIALKPDFREAVLNRGITLASVGEHKKAINDFSNYLILLPGDTMTLAYRAASYIETGNYDDAKADLAILHNAGQVTEKTLYQSGLSNLLTGDYEAAKGYLDQLLIQSPSKTQYLKVAALADLMQGDADGAISKYLQVLAQESPNQNTLSNLGYAFLEKSEHTMALSYFERALALGNESLSLNLGLLLCYDALGRNEDLKEAMERTTLLNGGIPLTPERFRDLDNQGYLFTQKQKRALEKILKAR